MLRNRKAVSSLVAAVILIAITLAGALFVYAYTSGVFNRISSKCEISVVDAKLYCDHAGKGVQFRVWLKNSGNLPLSKLNITLSGETTASYPFQTPFAPGQTQSFEQLINNYYTLYDNYGYIVEATATDGSTFTSLYNVQSKYYDVWPGITQTITFSFSGLDDRVNTTILKVDGGLLYNWTDMPSGAISFNWSVGFTHSFAWMSPLDVTDGIFSWLNTSGLDTRQSATITVPSTDAEIHATYGFVAMASITFLQTGLEPSITSPVLMVESVSYYYAELPISLSLKVNKTCTFSWTGSLNDNATSGKQYVWSATLGLSSAQSESIIIPSGGGVINATYNTQYELMINPIPPTGGNVNPTAGSYWYDSGTDVLVSATANPDYVFSQWLLDGNNWGSTNPTVLTVTQPHSLTASFTHQEIASVNFAFTGIPRTSYWLPGWTYRKSHVINPSTGAGTNYQVQIIVHYGSGTDSGCDVYLNGHCRTDFGDVRFTGSDAVTQLSYWMENKTDDVNAVFWVKITDDLSLNPVTIYIYYGNDAITTTSDGTATFPIMFDSFDSSTTIGDRYATTAYGSSYWPGSHIDITVNSASNNEGGSRTGVLCTMERDADTQTTYKVGGLSDIHYALAGTSMVTVEFDYYIETIDIIQSYWNEWAVFAFVDFRYSNDADWLVRLAEMYNPSLPPGPNPPEDAYRWLYNLYANDSANACAVARASTTVFPPVDTGTYFVLTGDTIGEWHSKSIKSMDYDALNVNHVYVGVTGGYDEIDAGNIIVYWDNLRIRKCVASEPTHGSWGNESETGVSANILTVDETTYSADLLCRTFSWIVDTNHTYSWLSPMNASGTMYYWENTIGLATEQTGDVTVSSGGGDVTATYVPKSEVLFNANLLNTTVDTVLVIDGTDYQVEDLPVLCPGKVGSSHTFAWTSSLDSGRNTFCNWVSSSGVSTLRQGTIVIPSGGGQINAIYQEVSQVSFYENGLDDSALGKVVMQIDGTNITYYGDPLLYSHAYPYGTVINYQFVSSLQISDSSRFNLANVNATSPLTATANTVVASTYQKQYRVLFQEVGLYNREGVWDQTILNINNGQELVNYTLSFRDDGYAWWQDEGTPCSYTWMSPAIFWIDQRQVIVEGQDKGWDNNFTCIFVVWNQEANAFTSVVTGSVSSAQTVSQWFYTEWDAWEGWSSPGVDPGGGEGVTVEIRFPASFIRYAFGTFYTASNGGTAKIQHRFGTASYQLDFQGGIVSGEPNDYGEFLGTPWKPDSYQNDTWIMWQSLAWSPSCAVYNMRFYGIPHWADYYDTLPQYP